VSVFLKLLQRHNLQSCVFSRFKPHRRGHAVVIGLLPTRGTDAPVVSRFQSRELKGGDRGRQIIALGLAVGEK
tara:strand:- start:396 stop:614 length:219 start_codon:yes stop_codon:yes gene_type:complete